MDYTGHISKEMKGALVPFTLVAFRGTGLVSKIIRVATGMTSQSDQDFSHVGLVITRECCPFIKQLQPGKLYILESMFSVPHVTTGVPDVISKQSKFGVQIRDLKDVVDAFVAVKGAAVAYAPLSFNPWSKRDDEGLDTLVMRRTMLIDTLQSIWTRHCNTKYEMNICELLATVMPCLRGPRDVINSILIGGCPTLTNANLTDDTTWLFCSEFVVIIYKAIGALPDHVVAKDVVPIDFWCGDTGVCGAPVFVGPCTKAVDMIEVALH